jgi:hypothetical protein
MNTFWLKIAGAAVAVVLIIVVIGMFTSGGTPSSDTPAAPKKTFYDQAAEDQRRLLAQPQAQDANQAQDLKARGFNTEPSRLQPEAPSAQQPATLYFKELSEIDDIEAEKLLNVAAPGRSIGRLPMTGHKLMVDSCRIILQRWPESWYAYRAKQMLAEMLPRDQMRYKVTPEELDVSMFTKPRPGTKPFTFKEGQ